MTGQASGPSVGCVTRIETGLAVVWTDDGEARASWGGGLLGRVARDRSRAPRPGDWVQLMRWSDGRITIEHVLGKPATVIPLRARA